jgi:hypothetical protein
MVNFRFKQTPIIDTSTIKASSTLLTKKKEERRSIFEQYNLRHDFFVIHQTKPIIKTQKEIITSPGGQMTALAFTQLPKSSRFSDSFMQIMYSDNGMDKASKER